MLKRRKLLTSLGYIPVCDRQQRRFTRQSSLLNRFTKIWMQKHDRKQMGDRNTWRVFTTITSKTNCLLFKNSLAIINFRIHQAEYLSKLYTLAIFTLTISIHLEEMHFATSHCAVNQIKMVPARKLLLVVTGVTIEVVILPFMLWKTL